MDAAIKITSRNEEVSGRISIRVMDTLDYEVIAWRKDGVIIVKRCTCPEYDDKNGDTCRHIEHVNIVMAQEAEVAEYNRYLDWTAQEQAEEIAAYVDAMVAEMQGTRRIAIELEDIVYNIGQALRQAA